MTDKDDCHLCRAMTEDPPEALIYADDLWQVRTAGDVPGWIMAHTVRHGEGIWGCTPEEEAEVGPLSGRLARALRQTVDSYRIYLLSLGENALHYHFMLVARAEDAPREHIGLGVVAKAAELADKEQAYEVAAKVRAVLQAG